MVAIIIPGRNGPLVAGGTAASGAVWNSSDKSSGSTLDGTHLILSSTNTGVGEGARSDLSHSTGKYYAEFTLTTLGFRVSIGIGNSSWPFANRPGNADFDSCGVAESGDFYVAGGSSALITGGIAQGDTVDIAVDLTAQKFWARKNTQNWNTATGTVTTANVASGTGGVSFSGVGPGSGPPWFLAGYQLSGGDLTARFSSSSWLGGSHDVPSGFGAY